MSGRHWLEREQKDSPGLQRIQEAQQAAAAAKALAEQQAREAAIATQEAERKRLEMIARIEQKTAQVLPLLEEIRDYANRTKTYPLGPHQFDEYNAQNPYPTRGLSFRSSEHLMVPDDYTLQNPPCLVRAAEIHVDLVDLPGYTQEEKIIEVKYGYKGLKDESVFLDSEGGGGGWVHHTKDAVVWYGVRLKVRPLQAIELCLQTEDHIPKEKFGLSQDKILLKQEWKIMPNSNEEQRQILADAFHNPAYLDADTFVQPIEPQTSTGIAGLVKGFLGLK